MRHPNASETSGVASARGLCVGIVASRFNPEITERLLEGATQTLLDAGMTAEAIRIVRVPGAFEIPVAAKWLADAGRCDGVLCLGCVIRGATAHYEHICRTCADGIQHVAVTTGLPVIFGVLTAETPQQAAERAGGRLGNMGAQGAQTLIEMAHVMRALRSKRATNH